MLAPSFVLEFRYSSSVRIHIFPARDIFLHTDGLTITKKLVEASGVVRGIFMIQSFKHILWVADLQNDGQICPVHTHQVTLHCLLE